MQIPFFFVSHHFSLYLLKRFLGSTMAMATRAIRCQVPSLVTRCESSEPIKQIQIQQRPRGGDLAENGKIVLQPRLCTLRSYGSEMIVAKKDGGRGGDEGSEVELASPFFETLTDYIESSKKSQDFETISGRLAMVKKQTLNGRVRRL